MSVAEDVKRDPYDLSARCVINNVSSRPLQAIASHTLHLPWVLCAFRGYVVSKRFQNYFLKKVRCVYKELWLCKL